jgi:hypothetical protein
MTLKCGCITSQWFSCSETSSLRFLRLHLRLLRKLRSSSLGRSSSRYYLSQSWFDLRGSPFYMSSRADFVLSKWRSLAPLSLLLARPCFLKAKVLSFARSLRTDPRSFPEIIKAKTKTSPDLLRWAKDTKGGQLRNIYPNIQPLASERLNRRRAELANILRDGWEYFAPKCLPSLARLWSSSIPPFLFLLLFFYFLITSIVLHVYPWSSTIFATSRRYSWISPCPSPQDLWDFLLCPPIQRPVSAWGCVDG